MRPITLKTHPDNIWPFTAQSVIEALLLSDEALRRGYDAAIWINPGKTLESAERVRADLPFSSVSCPPELQPHFERASSLERQYRRQSFKMAAAGLDRSIEASRFAALQILRIAFRSVIAEGRCQMHADYAPHIDPEPNPEIEPDPAALFEGKHIKLVRALNKAGMGVFDDRDHRLFRQMGLDEFCRRVPLKWHVAISDVAIFKAHLLHTTVPFSLSPDETPRTADIEDCTGGIPLRLARQLV